MELSHYAIALAAAGMKATFFPTDAEFDVERIEVLVDVDGFEEPLTILVTQPPVGEGALDGLDLVQIYAPIPVELTDDQLVWMALAVSRANELAALVGFSVREEESFLYFRTLMLLPPGEIALKMIVEGVMRTHYTLDLHAAILIEGAFEDEDDEEGDEEEEDEEEIGG